MKAIGIDLGTTNSVAAFYDGYELKALLNSAGETLTPSVVSYRTPKKKKEGEFLVGQFAVNNALFAPKDTIYSVKRLMGHLYNDSKIQELKNKVAYQIVTPSEADQEQGVRVILNDTEYAPSDISAMILREIKIYAEKRLGEEVTHAVITVPAYFEERQRAATRKAGEDAGFIVKMIMSEPVAAALAFGWDAAKEQGKRILVFDFGGGTFDISIIQMCNKRFQVMYHGGNTWLGGDDFDKEIINTIIQNVLTEQGFDPAHDPEFQAKAKLEAQKAKHALTGSNEYEIIMNPAGKTSDGTPFTVEITITRQEFETMITKYVDESLELTRTALREQELRAEDISDILLVGGSTKVPLIQRRLEQEFPKTQIRSNINPMECVGLGASIMAAKLRGIECPNSGCYEDETSYETHQDTGNRQHTVNDETATVCKKCGTSLAAAKSVSDLIYGDITPMHYGVRAVKGDNLDAYVPIIEKGTPYPLPEAIRRTFYTTEENQQCIKVPIFEGMHDLASQNDQQGIVEWTLEESLSVNTPVEVSFNLNQDRILTIGLRVMGRDGLFHEVTLQRDRPQEINETIPETRDEDESDWQEEAGSIMPAAEQFLQYFGTYMKAGTVEKMQKDIAILRDALEKNNEIQASATRRDIYLTMIGGAGIASQLYLAERACEGASPEVAKEIRRNADELRLAHESASDQGDVMELVQNLKAKIGSQFQTLMRQVAVEDKVNYEDLLRFKP